VFVKQHRPFSCCFQGFFVHGVRSYRFWPDKANPIGLCVENLREKDAVRVEIEFSTFSQFAKQNRRVHFTKFASMSQSIQTYAIPHFPNEQLILRINELVMKGTTTSSASSSSSKICSISFKDSLYRLSEDDKELLWVNRFFLRNKSHALSKLLLCVDWTEPPSVIEIVKCLGEVFFFVSTVSSKF
jgi:hypothetical protein